MTSSELVIGMAPVPDDPGRPTPETVRVPDTSVYIAFPTSGANLHVLFHRGVQVAMRYDQEQGWNNLTGEKAEITGANISKARNLLAAWFLDETEGEWLWFVDTDMVIEETTLPRLLCSAQVAGARVIGALCVIAEDADGPIPTLYQLGQFGQGEITRCMLDYPDNTVLQVAATGGACLLVHRDVLEDVRRRSPGNPYPWFREDVVNGEWLSEDVYFTLMANSMGHPVFVDCTTPVGHAKGKTVWWPADIRARRGFPPEKTYVVVPVKDRLDLTSSLVGQLRAQGGYEGIAVLDNGSGRPTKNWLESQDDLHVVDAEGLGIHEMWNLGAEWAIEDSGQRRGVNVAFLNNDLDLGERFLERLARALRSDPNVAAVSGNYDGRPAGGKVYERTQDICADRYDGSGGFAGFAFMVKAEFIGSGYRFPEECKWWFGDNDLLLAAEYAGGHVGIALEAEVVHLDGGAGTAGDAQWSAFREQTDRDQAAFEARWARLLAARDDRPREDESELEAAYRVLCRRPSDIYEHLPALVDVATRAGAQRIIELGVRTGVSTVAWLTALERLGSGELWSVDTGPAPFEVPGWNFVQGDDLDPAVLRRLPGEADVVFVDTDHRYGLTRDEIRTYARRVRPGGAMVFHDTNVEIFDHHAPGTEPPYPVHKAVCEAFDPPGGGETAFEVAKVERHDNCNGLTVVWRAEEAPVPARLPAPAADDEALVPA